MSPKVYKVLMDSLLLRNTTMYQRKAVTRQGKIPLILTCCTILLLLWLFFPLGSIQAAERRTCLVSSLPEIAQDDLRAALSTFLRSCDKYREVGPDKIVGSGYVGPRPPLNYQQLMQVCADAKGLMFSDVGQQEMLTLFLNPLLSRDVKRWLKYWASWATCNWRVESHTESKKQTLRSCSLPTAGGYTLSVGP